MAWGGRAALRETLCRPRHKFHKWRNLQAKAPRHCHGELKRDYHAVVYAEDATAARNAYQAFLAKWRKLAAEVARSLEEAGEDLFTFMRYPRSQWKSLRTTNGIERLNEEFRRRTKTQGSFGTEAAALVLLYGLVALGQIQKRRIDCGGGGLEPGSVTIYAATIEINAQRSPRTRDLEPGRQLSTSPPEVARRQQNQDGGP